MARPDTFREVDVISGADAVPTISFADALASRDDPVVLFTPALLFTHGGFDRDPVIEFDARFPAESSDLRPFCVDLTRDHEFFFRGFGSLPAPGHQRIVNWDKRVYGIPNSRKEECFSFLGGIAFSNPKTGVFANTFSNVVPVLDPTSRTGQFVDITVFGVMSNVAVVYVERRLRGPGIVRSVSMKAYNAIPKAIREAGLLGGFTGEDPLIMRDKQ
jgi:hypothetical protein